ncbi:beta-1,3-galactosyltransferase 1-like [Littorina saxatilis]
MCVTLVTAYSVMYSLFLSSHDTIASRAGSDGRYQQRNGAVRGQFPAKNAAYFAQGNIDNSVFDRLPRGQHIHFHPEKLHGGIAGDQSREDVHKVQNDPHDQVNEIRKTFNRRVKQYRVPRQQGNNAGQIHFQSQEVKAPHPNCNNCTRFPMPGFSKKLQNLCGDPRFNVVELVVLVSSRVVSFDERQVLRETWLGSTRWDWAARTRHIFLVGRTSKVSASKRLLREMDTYGDILQGNFPEGLRPETHKTMLGLTWVTRYCFHAKHVLKVDQDVWVNLPALVFYLRHHPLLQPTAVGGFCKNNEMPIRDPRSKYFASEEQYPDPEYPPFCSGPGYVTTPAVAKEIVKVSRGVPFFHLEDVYIGFCLRSLRMNVKHLPGFSLGKRDLAWITELCQLHDSRLILRQGFTPDEILFIWNEGKCRRNVVPRRLGLPLSKRQQQRRDVARQEKLLQQRQRRNGK